MDRVAEIIDLEKRAVASETDADTCRWEQARLIADELASGKSTRKLGEETGISHVEVFRRSKAWQRYGNRNDRPTFAQAKELANPQGHKVGAVTAHATNGRYEPQDERRGTQRSNRAPERDGEVEDESPGSVAGAWIRTAANALDSLASHRAAWQFMTEDDYQRLAGLPEVIRRILADVDFRKAKIHGR